MTDAEKIAKALYFAAEYGQEDGAHHKLWVIDQMVRALTGCPIVTESAIDAHGTYTYETQGESPEYVAFVADYENGEDGPDTYTWDQGIPP